MNVKLDIPPELVELVAERAAEMLGERESSIQIEDSGYLDVEGAAEFLACPTSRIYALKSAGRLPYEKDGSRLLFDRAELRAYVKAGGAVRP